MEWREVEAHRVLVVERGEYGRRFEEVRNGLEEEYLVRRDDGKVFRPSRWITREYFDRDLVCLVEV